MRITKRRWLILTILVLTSVIVVMAYLFNRKRLCVPSQDLTEIVETGDLVFSAGESIRSDIVRFMNADSECEYSHIGLVIKGESDYKIVHMSSDLGYIVSQSIDDFIETSDSYRLGIYRIERAIDKDQMKEIVKSLLQDNKKFDDAFDINDDSEYYCTEFIYKVFRDLGSEVYHDFKFKEYILPNDIINSVSMHKIVEI